MRLKALLEKLKIQIQANEFVSDFRIVEDLVCHCLDLSWSQLKLNADKSLTTKELQKIEHAVEKLLKGVPLAYITNEAYFYKYKFYVDDRVLIPRPETEILVEKALDLMGTKTRVADLGSGSGCIGLSLAKERPGSSVYLVDASKEALAVCQRNSALLAVENIELVHCQVGREVPSGAEPCGSFDLIVANPPYIEKGDQRVGKSVDLYEPHQALYAENLGLEWIQLWLKWAGDHLSSGGHYIFEFGKDQEARIRPFIEPSLWESAETIQDYSGSPRFFLLKKKAL